MTSDLVKQAVNQGNSKKDISKIMERRIHDNRECYKIFVYIIWASDMCAKLIIFGVMSQASDNNIIIIIWRTLIKYI